MRSSNALRILVVAAAVAPASAQRAVDPARLAPGHTCSAITQAAADASAGTVNINHDGTPIAGTPAPDISRGLNGIPRSAQPRLTASRQRILECTHRLAEANADIPYTLFVPSSYNSQKPAPLVVDLHGPFITPPVMSGNPGEEGVVFGIHPAGREDGKLGLFQPIGPTMKRPKLELAT